MIFNFDTPRDLHSQFLFELKGERLSLSHILHKGSERKKQRKSGRRIKRRISAPKVLKEKKERERDTHTERERHTHTERERERDRQI